MPSHEKTKSSPAKSKAEAKTTTPTINAQADSSKYIAKHNLVMTKTAGGNISEFPFEFTKDSKYFFSCVGSCVKVYSVATGAVVKVLSRSPASGGHNGKITRVILNPKNPMQLYSASLDGTIKLWDYNDEILLKTYRIGAAIEHMVISAVRPEEAYIVVNKETVAGEKKEKNEKIVYRYALGNDLPLTSQDRLRWITSMPECHCVDVSNDGRFVAMAGRYKCVVWKVTEGEERVSESELRSYTFKELLTVLAFSPDNTCIAVGDQSGRITLQYCLAPGTEAKPLVSVFHWHHLPVKALRFMGDGTYLMSGGDEAVLVIWQLETDNRQFLPRLGGSITSINISPNHKYYSVGLADNSIRLINSISQTIEQVIQGLQYAQVESNRLPLTTGLMVEPRNNNIVLNGVPGSLQFYNTQGDHHVMDLEVAPTNHTARKEITDKIVTSNVEHVAFLPRGEWMATVDMRDDGETSVELYLKFWQWNPNSQSYALHTRVDYPHSQAITSLTFSPSTRHGPMAITTSADKTFKVWVLSTEREVVWTCRSVGVYRDSPATAAAFSDDGSILAVAFGSMLTLWDPYENTLQGILAQPSDQESIVHAAFLGDSPYVVTASKTHFYVWNMLTCSVWWSYRCPVDQLAVDPLSGRIAIVHSSGTSGRVLVFEAKSGLPLVIHTLPHRCTAVTWVPQNESSDRETKSSNLAVLDNSHDLIILSVVPVSKANAISTASAEESSSKTTLETDGTVGILDGMFGERRDVRQEDREQEELRLKTALHLREEAMKQSKRDRRHKTEDSADPTGLKAPSHVLPHVENMFETFMGSLMRLRINNDSVQEVGMDIDSEATPEPIKAPITDVDTTFIPSEDFTSLTAYFSTVVSNAPIKNASEAAASSSENEDTDDDEDASQIDW
ncbi:quinon protein alcohol dehydrogenase-like superfamily [Phycomyces nitens]|nr:quinon protein alcohol dehydrogenase-like superfamily [Phycomyces nitens]